MAYHESISPRLKTFLAGSAAEVVALGVAANMPHWFESALPSLRSRLIASVSRHAVMPWVEHIQPFMENMFEARETKVLWNKAKAEGAEAKALFMAEKMVDLAIAVPGSFASSALANRLLEQNLLKQQFSMGNFWKGAMMEGGIHLGVMIGGPKVMPNQFATMKSWLCKTLQKVGLKPDTADSISQNAVYSGIGDAMGFAVNILYRTLQTPKGGPGL